MSRDYLVVMVSSIITSIVSAFGIIFVLFSQNVLSDSSMRVVYLLVVVLVVNFILTSILALIRIPMEVLKITSLGGNFLFFAIPLVNNIQDFGANLKVFFVLALTSVLHLTLVDGLSGQSAKNFRLSNNLFDFVHSKVIWISLLSVVLSVFLLDLYFLLFTILMVIAVSVFEEVKRYLVVSKNQDYQGNDIILMNVNSVVSSITKKLEDNASFLNALKLQVEIFSNSRKEIYSSIESIKMNITASISDIQRYEEFYDQLIQSMNLVVSNYSNYILGLEYHMSKVRNLLESSQKLFSSFQNRISLKISKREEIFRFFNETNPILESLLNKVDSISEILTNIISDETYLSENLSQVAEELSALNVISTNAQIESFKTKGSKTMNTIINEITSIQNNIRGYVTSMQEIFTRIRGLFDYLTSVSNSTVKHSDRVRYNIGNIRNSVDDLVQVFSTEMLKISDIDKNFEEINNAILHSYDQIRGLREFLEKISTSVAILSEAKEKLLEMKSTLNNILIVLEEIQQNVSET